MMRGNGSDARLHVIGSAMRHARKLLRARIAALAAAPDDEFIAGWPLLVAQVEAAFRHEETLMECSGHGNLQAHLADNALALCALHRVTPRIEAGDTALGREALAALDAILSLHRFTADLALVGAGARLRKPAASAVRIVARAAGGKGAGR